MCGQERGPEGGGVDVVEVCFDVEEDGGDLEFGPLEGPDFMRQGEAGVRGAKAGEGAALVGVEHILGAGHSGEPDRHDSFKNLRHGLEEDYYVEGCWGVVPGLSWFVQDNAVRIFQRGGVVLLKGHQGRDDSEENS